MGTVSCLFQWPAAELLPVRGHLLADISTYGSGHRPQFPHSWLQDWGLENRHQDMTLENPPWRANQC